MDYEYDGGRGRSYERVQCRVCKRQFTREALSRHQPICGQTARKNRRVFDSFKQRARGTEISSVRRRDVKPKKSNWRQQHQEFVRMVRAARGIKTAIQRGGPLPPPPPPSLNPDYIQCEYCGRRFNERAAERHITFCREQHQRIPRVNTSMKPNNTYRNRSVDSRMSGVNGDGYPPDYYDDRQMPAYTRGRTPALKKGPNSGYVSDRYTRSETADLPHRRNNEMENGRSSRASSLPGKPLRTGRSAETYYEGRQLGAMQKATIPQASRGSRYGAKPGSLGATAPSNYNRYRDDGESYNSNRRPASRQQASTARNEDYYSSGYNTRAGWRGGGTVNRTSRYDDYTPPPVPPKRSVLVARGGIAGGVPRGSSMESHQPLRTCYDCGAKSRNPTARMCYDCGSVDYYFE